MSGNVTASGDRKPLLDLGFLELDMLARHGVVFLDRHLLGHGARVLLRHVEIAGVGRRDELDLGRDGLSHGVPASGRRRARRSAASSRTMSKTRKTRAIGFGWG